MKLPMNGPIDWGERRRDVEHAEVLRIGVLRRQELAHERRVDREVGAEAETRDARVEEHAAHGRDEERDRHADAHEEGRRDDEGFAAADAIGHGARDRERDEGGDEDDEAQLGHGLDGVLAEADVVLEDVQRVAVDEEVPP